MTFGGCFGISTVARELSSLQIRQTEKLVTSFYSGGFVLKLEPQPGAPTIICFTCCRQTNRRCFLTRWNILCRHKVHTTLNFILFVIAERYKVTCSDFISFTRLRFPKYSFCSSRVIYYLMVYLIRSSIWLWRLILS